MQGNIFPGSKAWDMLTIGGRYSACHKDPLKPDSEVVSLGTLLSKCHSHH